MFPENQEEKMPIPTEGQLIANLISLFLKEDKSQYPEFTLGFKAVRWKDLVRMVKQMGLDEIEKQLPAIAKGGRPKDRLVEILNGLAAQGRFDEMTPKHADPKDNQIAALSGRIDQLMETVRALTKGKAEDALAGLTADDIDKLTFKDLKLAMKRMGLDPGVKDKREMQSILLAHLSGVPVGVQETRAH